MFTTKALAGQIGKNLLDRVQSMSKPFGELPQATQQAIIDGCMADGKAVVQGAFAAILEHGDAELDVTLHDATTKKTTVQAAISCPRDHEFADKMHKNAHAPARLHFLNVDKEELMSLGDEVKAPDDQEPMFADEPQAKEAPKPTKAKPKTAPKGRKKSAATKRVSNGKGKILIVEQTDVVAEEMDLASE